MSVATHGLADVASAIREVNLVRTTKLTIARPLAALASPKTNNKQNI